LGAIVVMIDGRGTSRRGQSFRLPAFQNLGEVGLDDHIALIRQMAARYPYMDTSRVGVYGGSAGAMMRRASCCAGRSSSRWASHPRAITNCGWTRPGGPRSMGLADDATWDRNSNLSVAKNLKGKLLLVHGDIDDNVPITASFRLEKALIDAGKDVDMVVCPTRAMPSTSPITGRNSSIISR
jgi:dipeptidyl aminopeptidase/acylaminoacyl peptidase